MPNTEFNYYIDNKKDLILLGIKSKKPLRKNWQNSITSYQDIISKHSDGYNVGMRLTDTDLIIDVDVRNFNGQDSLGDLQRFLGFNLKDRCPAVRTGSGGYHFYMKKPAQLQLKETIDKFQGIEFKSKGRQVVCAGSIHPKTNQPYEWINDIAEPYPVPQNLIDVLQKPAVETEQSCETIRNDQLADLLSQLPVEDFSSNDQWFPILCASHHATNGEGIDEFVAWSLKDPKYANCENDIRTRWESLGGKQINFTVATLYKTVLKYGGDVNRIVHDFDGMEDSDTDTAKGIALKLANSLTTDSSNDDILKAIKATIQCDAIEQVQAQKQIMKVTKLTRSDLNKIIVSVKEKLIDDLSRQLADNTLKNRFLGGKTLVMNNNGQFWYYEGRYWKPVIKDYIGKKVTQELDAMRAKEVEILTKENTIVSDAVSIIARLTSASEDVLHLRDKPKPVLNCQNGELWLDKVADGIVTLKEHNPLSYLTMITSVKYDPDAKCPRYERSLRETFQNFSDCEDIIRHFYEFIGYILHPDKRPAHWFLLRGPGSDGKSTQMKIISALLGDAVVPDSIERYRGGAYSDTHATSDLVGKLLVFEEDLNINTVLPDGTLKKLSEDGELTANPKNYQPFKFTKVCTVVMCCNGLPKTKDVTRGFRRRAMLIPFDRGFKTEEMDTNLADYIIHNELSGVLNKAIEGMKRLKKRGYFQEPISCIKAKEAWLDAANPVASFARDAVVDSSGDTVLLPELYDAFMRYCDDQNYTRVPPKSEFSATFEQLGYKFSKNSTHSKKYINICLKNEFTSDSSTDDMFDDMFD